MQPLKVARNHVSALRQLPRLRRIATRMKGDDPAQTAEEFWKEYDTQPKGATKQEQWDGL